MAADQFSGCTLMPSQFTEFSISPSKIRTPLTLIPVTVKQIIEAYSSSEDKSSITVDGVNLANVRLVGLAMNKVERDSEVSFTLDDGTGRIEMNRWANETSDTDEVASIQNGAYVKVHGHLRGFHGKRHALAFSVQSLADFNDIALHFIECIYVHLEHVRLKGGPTQLQLNISMSAPSMNGYLAPFPNQFLAHSSTNDFGNDIYNLVLGTFHEPAMLHPGNAFSGAFIGRLGTTAEVVACDLKTVMKSATSQQQLS
ncbi:hypothetical protein HPP92_017999 [Vanilla planifolia]|uniref:Uncharacterized protein n=1 Tax=Vanilla planifolia TaxID=51239 RepID=A0A835UR39_VANPL|nr:hypothetical protein HPP92_017999 [Vanilla planifolia]